MFPWLNEQIKEHRVRSLLFLGDTTDAKDNHSAELTNRVVAAFNSLRIDDITVLAGNHDWLKQGQEFFRFLNLLPNVQFITSPTEDKGNIRPGHPSAFYLPYSKQPHKDWKGLDFSHYDYLFLHQTLPGSVASNGQVMDGEELPPLNAGRVLSGDIHVPQDIGGLTYVGSPYHVHFGDNFRPRCILIDKNRKEHDLHFETIKRVAIKVKSLRELERTDLRAGDQVKLTMELAEADKHTWSSIRRKAIGMLHEAKVSVHGVELNVVSSSKRVRVGGRQVKLAPNDAVYNYVQHEELGGAAYDAAMDILEDKHA